MISPASQLGGSIRELGIALVIAVSITWTQYTPINHHCNDCVVAWCSELKSSILHLTRFSNKGPESVMCHRTPAKSTRDVKGHQADCLEEMLTDTLADLNALSLEVLHHSQLGDPDLRNYHVLQRLVVRVSRNLSDSSDDIHSIDDLAKDGVVAIQIVLRTIADVEL